jgi:hypothetical protein
VPRVLDYAFVLEQLQAQGLRCLYYNGGAFGFPPDANVKSVGWVGDEDPSLRPETRPWTRRVPQPYITNLVMLFERARSQLLPGEAWIMPKSHWAFELDHSPNAAWLCNALTALGVDAGSLRSRTDAAAITFNADEPSNAIVEELLSNLRGSDFAAVFPSRDTLCTIHHHQQLWWQTTDQEMIGGLDRIFQSTQSSS